MMHPAYDDEPTVPLPVVRPEPVRRRRRRRRPGPVAAAVTLVVVVLAAIGLLAWPLVFRPAVATGGEVFRESTTNPGRDPFTDSVVVGNPPGTKSQSPPASGAGAIATVAGDTPALYGGSRNEKACDREKLVAFLQQNPAKAAAWAGVLGIPTADIATYVATLTPVQLRADTRVTNHGYVDGHATTLQSVLQAGTAVLVDDLGRPRVKCGCGNPLLDPVATPVAPVYTGDAWPGFDPAALSAVSPASAPIAKFIVHDLRTGETFTRPRGTAGEADALTDAPVVTPPVVAPANPDTGPAPPDLSCPSGEIRVAGRCVPRPVSCRAGSHPAADGASCVPDAPGICPQGTHRDGGTCVDDAPITCPAGSHPVSDGTSCAKDAPPVCQADQHLVNGNCVPNTPTCTADQHLVNGNCVPNTPTCKADEQLVNGKCVPRTPTCTADQHLVNGACVKNTPTCKADEQLVNGKCIPTTPTCTRDEHLVDGRCVPNTPTCTADQHLVDGNCVPNTPTCKADEQLVDGACVKNTPDCPPGQAPDASGVCRVVLTRRAGNRRPRRGYDPCSSANSPRRYSS